MADKTGYIGRNPGDSSVKVARQTFTPTTSTTNFTFAAGYTVGYLDLFYNGSKLIEGTDYNANNGTTISMLVDAIDGDVLEAVAYKAFNVGDASASSTGNFTVGNDLTVTNDAAISQNLNVTGVTTTGLGLNVSAGGANISGVVTATSYKGDGSALTGIAATDTIAAASLTVSGITTLTGVVKGLSDVRITGNINAGIATFSGDVKVGASATTLFADISHGRIGIGTDSPERTLQLGEIQSGAPSSANPPTLSLGSGYSSVANANPKLYIWDRKSDNSYMALGASDNQLDYMVESSSYSHNFYVASTKRLKVNNSGVIVTGVATATSFKGDGSALTGVGGDTDITSCLFI